MTVAAAADGTAPPARHIRPGGSPTSDQLSEENLARVSGLNEVARGRGQSLAQMALSWVLRDQRVTSALIGASSVEQLEENLAAAGQARFSEDELAAIDRYATEGHLNIWASSSAVAATRRSAEQ